MTEKPEPILKREMPVPGFDAHQLEAVIKKRIGDDKKREKLVDNYRFSALYDREAGIYGDRENNPHRIGPRRWIEKHVKVRSKAGAIVPMILNNSQRRLLAEILRMLRAGVPVRIIILKARQQGFSTLIQAFELYVAFTQRQSRCFIITHKRTISQALFEKATLMVRSMEKGADRLWEFNLETDTRERMTIGEPVFSSLFIESAEANQPLRGETPTFLHLSENPSWKRADDVAQAVLSALPSVKNSYAFNEATAKGDNNMFAREFRSAWKSNRFGSPIRLGWRAIFFPWYFDQEYRWSEIMGKPLPEAERLHIERTLDDEETVLLDHRYFRRGHGWVNVDYDQLAWRRYAIPALCRADLNRFHEEYPATPDEAFIASGQRLFDPLLISKARKNMIREPVWVGELLDPDREITLLRTQHVEQGALPE